MVLIGLTGGIGSGKSTVATGLAARGAVIIDADRVARQVVEPGQPAYRQIVERFGAGVVGADGRLDRAAIAAAAFSDPAALADLNRMTHPAIASAIAARIAEQAGSDAVVVIDMALLDAARRLEYGFDAVAVVDTPVEEAVRRLVGRRGMTETDARARVAAQISREERLALADFVIDNAGPQEGLEPEIERAWRWMSSLSPARG